MRPRLWIPVALAVLVCAVSTGQGPPPRPQPPAADESFLARAREHIAAREYRASRDVHGLQAPNRAHALRTRFSGSGIAVQERTTDGAPLVALTLSGVGRGDALAPAGDGEIVAIGARVEIRRPGLVEWYENSPAGLEQGFTLDERPAGEGALTLALRVEGAAASQRGDRVVFRAPTGRRLEYGKLVAYDAKRRMLASRIELDGAGRLRLRVDDTGAAYPVVIDPVLTDSEDGVDLVVTDPGARFQSDQDSAGLGHIVDGAGDVNGDAYDDVIVGAPEYDAGEVNEGAAFIFLGSELGLGDGTPLTASTQLESDQAGAGFFGGLNPARLDAAAAGDVNGDGYDDVIVGWPGYDGGGAAFVFLGSASGIPSANAATAASRLESDIGGVFLGQSLSGAGDVNGDGFDDVIVSPRENTSQAPVLIFLGSASGVLSGSTSTAATRINIYGGDVAGVGDVNGDGFDDVAIGQSLNGNGNAAIFQGGPAGIPDGFVADAQWRFVCTQSAAGFGTSVAGAGDVNGDGFDDVIIGAPAFDAGEEGEGAAFIFHGQAIPFGFANETAAFTRIESNVATPIHTLPQLGGQLGTSVSGAGDVNGDGYDDVIVTAPRFDGLPTGNPFMPEGAALLYLGGSAGIPNGTPGTAAARIASDTSNGVLLAASGAGDVNGDGFDDVIVGSRLYDAGETNEGAAFLYYGNARSIPEPGFALSLASGCALLSLLARRRSKRHTHAQW